MPNVFVEEKEYMNFGAVAPLMEAACPQLNEDALLTNHLTTITAVRELVHQIICTSIPELVIPSAEPLKCSSVRVHQGHDHGDSSQQVPCP